MDKATLNLHGREYVVIPRDEFDRLSGMAKVAKMPPLPKAGRDGNYPAIAYARASLARKIVTARVQAGLSQRELAKLAGVRVETLCRIETGKHTASVPTIDKLGRALRRSSRRTGA